MSRPALHPVRILDVDEPLPDPPAGFYREQIGLTAHLRRTGWSDGPVICGVLPGSRPRGPALGVCLDCWAIAR